MLRSLHHGERHESQKERIDEVAPVLKDMVKQHETGTCKEGVEAFNTTIMKVIDRAGLRKTETRIADSVGVYPGNREGATLVLATYMICW